MARILIVDDDPAQRYLFSLLLSRMGYESVTAENGARALEIMTNDECVDLILMDMNMPIMNGEQLVSELRRSCPHVPIVVMSVRSTKEIQPDILQHIEPVYLQKPFDRDQLLEAIRSAVRSDVVGRV